MMRKNPQIQRLWQAARFLPMTARFLGTRYRSLFLAYARQNEPAGEAQPVADALAFIDFMSRQERLALLDPERGALRRDERALRRRFRLRRQGGRVEAVEKWKILQWLRI